MTTKEKGDVYTPEYIVEHVLDIAGYKANADILGKKVIDPSCGDGAFLSVVAKRIISAGKAAQLDGAVISELVLECLSGIEVVEKEASKCRDNIATICQEAGIPIDASRLDIVNADTLEEYPNRIGSYDFVVGNPPYVRIHNLENSDAVQSLSYCEKGMTDLYLAFYEIGQELCARNGVLCYIAPSSWFSSRSGSAMREDLMENKKLSAVVDLEHHQPFEGITTYTAIVKITPDGGNDDIGFSSFDDYTETDKPALSSIPYSSAWINGAFVPISDEDARGKIREIMEASYEENTISVKNGFATNLDRFYIRSTFEDGKRQPVPSWIRPIVKASTAKWAKCFYPYDNLGHLFPLAVFSGYGIYDDLQSEKETLLSRNQVNRDAWWGYARSQGIADVEKSKVAVNTLYRDADDLKVVDVQAGSCVYGGVYVLGMKADEVEKACSSDIFMAYVRALRRYKSGGYYTLSGKELELFLRWWQVHLDSVSPKL